MRKLIVDVFASTGQTFASTQRHDPYRNFNFAVDFVGKVGIIKSGWNNVTGIKLRHDYKEYKEGGNNGVPDQMHTESRYEPITLRRGMSEDFSVLKLLSSSYSKNGNGITKSAKMDIVIKIKDRDRKKIVRKFTLRDAWVTAFETSDLDAMGAEVLMETIIVSFKDVDF